LSKKYIDYEDAIKSLEFLGKIVIAEEHGVSLLRSSLHSPSYDTVRDYIKRTNKALTPPTEEEICKALNEYLKEEIKYEDESFYADGIPICYITNHETFLVHNDLPLYIMSMIIRFYEGLSDVNE